MAVVVSTPGLMESVHGALQRDGRLFGGDDLLPAAIAVVADAERDARTTVAKLRARARSDAAIIVLFKGDAPSAELDAAYAGGAALCLRAPIDERQLGAAIGGAFELRAARSDADDLRRQLDLQAHLASLGRMTAGFTHEVSSP
ncbi:MAG: hypothetical protein ACRENE_19990, partial [Polyangiaceae bacterium]